MLIGAIALVAFYLGLSSEGYLPHQTDIPETALTHARTMTFVVLVVSQLLYAFVVRHQSKSMFHGFFSNRYLIAAVLVSILLQILVVSVPIFAEAFKVQPLNMHDWLICFALAIIPCSMIEISKLFLSLK